MLHTFALHLVNLLRCKVTGYGLLRSSTKKESKDIILKNDFEASRNFKVSFKQQIQTFLTTDAPLWKYYLSIFEVLYVVLWVQAFFFHLRTTHFSWTIPVSSFIGYTKVQEKNPEHLKAKQNLQFFPSYFKIDFHYPSSPNEVKRSAYSWHSETSDSSGVGLPSDFFHPMTYLLTAPCLW